ncbi:MAG: hypothetical protein IJ409_09905 [Lachnospiraceae bacterium]|nr:hypothetical protein [Lachnospiraceae bacterium]
MNQTPDNFFPSDGTYCAKEYIPILLSPLLEQKFHMQYLGNYKWCGPWENGTRKILQLFLLKGDTAVFEWGYNYSFLPIIQSRKLTYQRTDKNAAAQLRDLPAAFIDFEDWKPFCIPMHSDSEAKLTAQIKAVYNRTLPFIQDWYKRTATSDGMINEADFQINHQNYYKFFFPSQPYVKAFLLAVNGQGKEAEAVLESSDEYREADEDIRRKLMKKLTECKDHSL